MKRMLYSIEHSSTDPVPIWPPDWYTGEGARTKRAPSAPRKAKIIPVSCEETTSGENTSPAFFQFTTSREGDRATWDVDPARGEDRRLFLEEVDVGDPALVAFSSANKHKLTLLALWEEDDCHGR